MLSRRHYFIDLLYGYEHAARRSRYGTAPAASSLWLRKRPFGLCCGLLFFRRRSAASRSFSAAARFRRSAATWRIQCGALGFVMMGTVTYYCCMRGMRRTSDSSSVAFSDARAAAAIRSISSPAK